MVLIALLILTSFSAPAAAEAQPCPEISAQSSTWRGTPLHEAIRRNDVSAARSLMTAAAVNERDSLGNTPLVAALTPTASLEPAGVVNASKASAMIQAEKKARQAIVSALLEKGAAVSEPGAQGVTPLAQLAAWGYSPIVDRTLSEQFLQLGANVNARDAFGSTALILAAGAGKSDLVGVLLSKGADPKVQNCHGDTAVSLAQFNGHRKLAQRLRSAVAGVGR
jgi:ankyrin repeat protein